jgi:hypothetical protein
VAWRDERVRFARAKDVGRGDACKWIGSLCANSPQKMTGVEKSPFFFSLASGDVVRTGEQNMKQKSCYLEYAA